MDKQLFEQLLSQVADWEMPKLKEWEIKEAKKRARGRGRPSREDLYQEEHEEIFKQMFGGVNPTMTPELTAVKVKAVDCADCGEHCPNGRREDIKYFPATPGHIAHRRHRCLECNKYRDPEYGTYTLSQGPAAQRFLNWAKHQFVIRKKLNKETSGK
jgi:hypothetical protein